VTAFGYIRKSVVQDPARMLSPEMQEAAIRRLAEANGHGDVVILSDLDVSGRKGRDRRPGWDQLLRAVEDGDATAVYAYSLSRFARSVAQLADFFELCERKKVRIRVDRDQIDTSTATGRLVGNVLASLAQFEADVASERVKDAFAVKRAKDPTWLGPGNRPYGDEAGEDLGAVKAAFEAAGSFDGAARELNTRGVRTRLDGSVWHGATVREIVRREWPDLPPPNVTRGSNAGRRSFRLARLLACSVCGSTLVGSQGKRDGWVNYYCPRARVKPHGRGNVGERKVMPAIAAEAALMDLFAKRVQKGAAGDQAKLAKLAAKRSRVIDMAADGVIDKTERDRRLAEIAADESKLSTVRWVMRLSFPPNMAQSEPADVNAFLRRLFSRVVVDMGGKATMGPSDQVPSLDFEWRDPSLRGTGGVYTSREKRPA
jgi:DNA invertase Pin-like site-specific DNA recombinase